MPNGKPAIITRNRFISNVFLSGERLSAATGGTGSLENKEAA
jgi:DNA-binding sugar fermentation-stimulating protein